MIETSQPLSQPKDHTWILPQAFGGRFQKKYDFKGRSIGSQVPRISKGAIGENSHGGDLEEVAMSKVEMG